MTGGLSIARIRELPVGALGPLVRAARGAGFRAVQRLVDDWQAGTNRFDRPGEAIFVARDDGVLVGVCGLNRDMARDAGRVRRLFVMPAHRRRGIARALVAAVEAEASRHFPELVLRTFDPGAGAFYEALGFAPERGEQHTHRKPLGRAP